MPFRHFYFLALTFLLLSSLTEKALACRPSDAVCINQSCNEFDLGTTAIDYDKKSLIACLKNDAGQKVWKGLSTGNDYANCICRMSFFADSHGLGGESTTVMGISEIYLYKSCNGGGSWSLVSKISLGFLAVGYPTGFLNDPNTVWPCK